MVSVLLLGLLFFFFKQKTAYEMRISDWSSDVCSSDLRIAALIDRMQDFTIDQPMECVAENIYPLLDRAVELAAAGFARDVRLVRQYDPSLPFAEINGDAFVQVTLNLLKNAAEALEGMEQGEICIATAYRHGVSVMIEGRGNASLPIEIQISDNGPGVPDHIREQKRKSDESRVGKACGGMCRSRG